MLAATAANITQLTKYIINQKLAIVVKYFIKVILFSPQLS